MAFFTVFRNPSQAPVPGTNDTVSFTATFRESEIQQAEVTQHPVETGAAITDHVFLTPLAFTLETGTDRTRVEGEERQSQEEVYQTLNEIYTRRELVTVVSAQGQRFDNMVLKRISRDVVPESVSVLMLSLEFQQVTFAQSKTVAIPRAKTGRATGAPVVRREVSGAVLKDTAQSKADLGKKQGQEPSTRRKSILAGTIDSLGSLSQRAGALIFGNGQ